MVPTNPPTEARAARAVLDGGWWPRSRDPLQELPGLDYRGLWGLDTRDHFGGERAPAGPRYERDGAVRSGWANPVAWAGLDQEYPTVEHGAVLLGRRASRLRQRLAELAVEVDDRRQAARESRAGNRARAAFGSHAGAAGAGVH